MSSLDILKLEQIAKEESRKASIQGVLMDDDWHYWDSNSASVVKPKHAIVPPEPVSDYW